MEEQNTEIQLIAMCRDIKDIFIWGSSSHAGCTIEIIEKKGIHNIDFLYDPTLNKDIEKHGYEVISCSFKELKVLLKDRKTKGVIVAVGNNFVRKKVYQRIKNEVDLYFVNAIHKSCIISDSALLGKGIVMLAGSIVGRNSCIGEGAFIGTKSTVGHDTIVGDYSNVLMGSSVAGKCDLKKTSVVAMGSNVIQETNIGEGSVVGAGSLVVDDIPAGVIAYGSPAEVVRDRPDEYKYL